MKNKTKGFTLIELLVVIAIIGILSSVVLASLNSARNKGSDAAVKSNLANMRAQAEIAYDSNGNNYDTVCTATAAMLSAAGTAGSGTTDCNTSTSPASAWAATANLKSSATTWWCVDSTGASKQTTQLGANATVCP